MSDVAARRQFDRRLFLITAVAFPITILVGFGPTYYSRGLVAAPLPSLLVHVHGLMMTLWVGLFVVQVALISAKRVRLHRRLGYAAVGLAVLILATGLPTALRAAKYGSASFPPGIPPLSVTADFEGAFRIADRAGLLLVPHGGELRGPDHVRQCVDGLGAHRLGHGVRSVEDPALLDRLVESGVALEVCPVSNVSLGVYSDLTSVPLPQLLAAGATVALGADDPLLFGSRLAGQYATMRAAHDLDDLTLARLAEMSFTASQAPSDVVAAAQAGHRRLARLTRAEGGGGGGGKGKSERAADRHGLVDQPDAEALVDPVAHLAGERQQVLGAGAAAVGERQGVLGRRPRPLPRAGP